MIISPNILNGTVNIPASKSEAHRAIICASFADGKSSISNVTMSKDIKATINGLKNMGAEIEVAENEGSAQVTVGSFKLVENNDIIIDCHESGSTLRFLIPIAASLYDKVTFTGKNRLVKRPLDVYFEIFRKNNIKYSHGEDYLPLTIERKLQCREYTAAGDISSQFITGIMLASAMTQKPVEIKIEGNLESKPYIDITQDVMKKYGVQSQYDEAENKYIIYGGGYKANDFKVMGDWSHAGFLLLAGTRSKITICGLDKDSRQGDKVIVDILKSMGANIYWDNDLLISEEANLTAKEVDVSQCPDLAPVIAGAMAIAKGKSKIVGGQRLKIKESDRIQSIVNTINSLGGSAQATDDGMIIEGVEMLSGGEVSCYNDHRIAMLTGALSSFCTEDIKVNGHECVDKSYPAFWEDFVKLGGRT
ncbi:MAG: 3-phosphoshikimate 1-carboxyvinyltransferase [Eubacteriales bacterium]